MDITNFQDAMSPNFSNYHLEMGSYRSVGWISFALSTIGFIAALLAAQYWPALFIALFSTLALYIVLGAGSFDINSNGFTHKSMFGTWQIDWDEITSIEVGEMDGALVLHGYNKRFVLSPPSAWTGSDKDDAFVFLIKQFEARKLAQTPSRAAAYKIMKNTRVR